MTDSLNAARKSIGSKFIWEYTHSMVFHIFWMIRITKTMLWGI